MTPRRAAVKVDEAGVEGHPELVIHDEAREAIAEALADALLAAVAREQDVTFQAEASA